MTRIAPTIEAIDTRRAVQRLAETRHRRFEPVAVPGDRRRVTLRRVWNAIWPSLVGAAALLYIAGLCIGWAMVRAGS